MLGDKAAGGSGSRSPFTGMVGSEQPENAVEPRQVFFLNDVLPPCSTGCRYGDDFNILVPAASLEGHKLARFGRIESLCER